MEEDPRAPGLPEPDEEEDEEAEQEEEEDPEAYRREFRRGQAFVEALEVAELDNSGLDGEALARLRNPLHEIPAIAPQELAGIRMYLARGDASEANYADVRAACMDLHPEPAIPPYEAVKRQVSKLTGITPVRTDMCENSCIAYTGPFANLLACPYKKCSKPRYDSVEFERGRRVPRRTFLSFPIGPQIQAMWSSPENARLMRHRATETRAMDAHIAAGDPIEFLDDVYSGSADDDTVLMFSIDGAQLYANKQSDCWFFIWTLLDLPPTVRYQKRYVIPAAPKNLDSFMFPSLYHGLRMWDAAAEREFSSRLYVLLVGADSPAMAYLNGLVGHNGKHAPGSSTYYPALLRPTAGDDSAQGDIDEAAAVYIEKLEQAARLETGISKPSILSGLSRFQGIPHGCVLDNMHLICLNLTDLLLPIYRGTFERDESDDLNTWTFAIFRDKDVWKDHGKLVAQATRYLPGSFDRPPRNPAEKLSSGFKAWEFLLYVYGLLPILLRGILPDDLYTHFCKLVTAVRIVLQFRIPLTQLPYAQQLFLEYVEEFEEKLHFIRPSLHTLTHLVTEAIRWTLENYIGNITREIKQHVTPYANVSERALRRCQVNALKAMIPALADTPGLPDTAVLLGDDYVLLRARARYREGVLNAEAVAIRAYVTSNGVELKDPHWAPVVRRWARLLLPNGQIARTAWKEREIEDKGRDLRRSRMVKLAGDRFAEVLYFFRLLLDGQLHTLAVVSVFSAPDPALVAHSHGALKACFYRGHAAIEAISVKSIVSVVAMIPMQATPQEAAEPGAAGKYINHYAVVEKPGLDIALIAGHVEDPRDDADGMHLD
ncbi:hypothetical protein K466DRAFT_578255 [Polyporus arcularius HHB13444]|uniref:Uncharacterized protein n=1 Tax=Polyporus arcularius HHB13444 TaxID=1314778 RepID=A0A5C3NXZ9_9APHY|nr:hypothetical protein K466DRAFT_578255 [Polyporus arcularius HHB13444]